MDDESPDAPDTPAPLDQDEGAEASPILIIGLRVVLVALVALVGILIVGKLVVAGADLKDDGTSRTISGPVPVSPITTQPSAFPVGVSSADAADDPQPALPSLSVTPAPVDVPPRHRVAEGLILKVSPASVASGGSFTVRGTYAGRDGVDLWLQRLENGAWANYPNTVTVSMGSFAATATSTMPGTNSFRVYDQSAGRASNVVSVFVR